MALSKNAYIAVLCLAFFYSVLKSYLNVLDEPTTFEEYVDHKAAFLPRYHLALEIMPAEFLSNSH